MTTPQTPAYIFTTLKGSFSVTQADVPATPRGRAARLRQATVEALPVLLARLDEWASQSDEPAIMVIATVDSDIGKATLAKGFGPASPLVFRNACGPFAWVQPLKAWIGEPANEDIKKAIADLNAQQGDVVVAFAVNHTAVEYGLMRFDEGAPEITVKPEPSGPPTVFAFVLTGEPEPDVWVVAVGGGLDPVVRQHIPGDDGKPTVTFTLSRDDMANMVAGLVDPQALYSVGRLKIEPLRGADEAGLAAWEALIAAAKAGTVKLPPPPAQPPTEAAPVPPVDAPQPATT